MMITGDSSRETQPSPASPGLYLHVPFCSGKCPYCDFYSLASPRMIPQWLEAVTREAALYPRQYDPFDTLYLGGGTPSRLSPDHLHRLFDSLTVFQFLPGREVTVEVNPEDVTRDKAAFLKAGGVNRISMGIQSFSAEELRFLGRRHSAEQAKGAIGVLRESGFANLSLDLMYALPGQSWNDWQRTLDQALAFRPEHLSCYQLTIEEGTGFHVRLEKGAFEMPDDGLAADLFIKTSQYLEDQGYLHYEISNFARTESLMSRHNRKYWDHTPYLGLGPSAHSFRDGERWWHPRSVRQYVNALAQGRSPEAGREKLTREQWDLETIYLGLRTREGVPLDLLFSYPENRERVGRLIEHSLAEVSGGRLVLTRKGMAAADHLTVWLAP